MTNDVKTEFWCPWHLVDEQDGKLCRALRSLVADNSSQNGAVRIQGRVHGMSLIRGKEPAKLIAGPASDVLGFIRAVEDGYAAFPEAERATLPVVNLIQRVLRSRLEREGGGAAR
jgi:hypothetical protein